MKATNTVSLVVAMLIGLSLTGCQYFKAKQQASIPQNNYFENLWLRSQLFLKEQEIEKAESSLRELYAGALTAEPEISARALFELAQINERKGQWLTAIAQFKECELKKNYLTPYKADLELPARLSGLYATLGELKMSQVYAQRVEANIQTYLQQMSLIQQKGWWAETFYRIGSFPIQYITPENWQEFADRFHSTSQYLVRSMELADPIWSNRSLELSQQFFTKSFEYLSIPTNEYEENTVLLGASIKDRINQLDEIIRKIYLYKPVDMSNSRIVSAFYTYVEDFEKKLNKQLYQVKDSAPLSRESQLRNALERRGQLKSVDPIDNSQKDPNL